MNLRTTILLAVFICINISLECEAFFNPCRYGWPYPNTNCDADGHVCPDDHYCALSDVGAYALCCPDYCHGDPLMNEYHQPEHCGRGGIVCPDDFYCKIAPDDRWAVCCPNVE